MAINDSVRSVRTAGGIGCVDEAPDAYPHVPIRGRLDQGRRIPARPTAAKR